MEISVALGGGGIKGLAHIGVLDCLEESGFKIKAVAGTSAGGLFGAVYAAGYKPKEILEMVESLNQNKLYSRLPADSPSLLGYAGLAEFLSETHGDNLFSDLKIPFACTAVDLKTAQEVYLNEGRVMDAVLATIAVPGIFPSRSRGEAELIDGGVLDPVPVNLARCIAPALPVVAVALTPAQDQWYRIPEFNILPPVHIPIPTPIIEGFSRMRIAQAFRIFLQSMDITARMLTEMRLEIDQPEVIVRPDVHEVGLLDNVVPEQLYRAGYAATEAAVPEIHKSLSWPRTVWRILRQPSRRQKGKRQEEHAASPTKSSARLPGATK